MSAKKSTNLKTATKSLAEVQEKAELPPELADKEPTTFGEAVALAGMKPDDTAKSSDKVAYAARLSALFAKVIKHTLAARHPKDFGAGIRVGETTVGTGHTEQKIDVLYGTQRRGMLLNISIKTQSFKDCVKGQVKQTKAYCHNPTRIIDQEFQIEAKTSHMAFPRATLVALVFFPKEASEDANPIWNDPIKRRDGHCSSIAEFAQRLRGLSGRTDLRNVDQESWFEAAYIAVHGLPADSGDDSGIRFFDVGTPLKRQGLPDKLLTFEEWLDEIASLYRRRHAPRREWAGEEGAVSD